MVYHSQAFPTTGANYAKGGFCGPISAVLCSSASRLGFGAGSAPTLSPMGSLEVLSIIFPNPTCGIYDRPYFALVSVELPWEKKNYTSRILENTYNHQTLV